MAENLVVIDLFCGAGGAARGIELAAQDAGVGVTIIGVDNRPQPRYPYNFIQGEWDSVELDCADFVWASPPCQGYTAMNHRWNTQREKHPLLIEPVRAHLRGRAHVIENVVGAPLLSPVTLCGQYFGLAVRRHRKFEVSFPVTQPECKPFHRPFPIAVYGEHPERHMRRPGKGGYVNRAHDLYMGRAAMGIGWMEWRELTQAIPPAYSRYIFSQWLRQR